MGFQVTPIKELSIYTEFYFIYFIISDNIKFVNDKWFLSNKSWRRFINRTKSDKICLWNSKQLLPF